MEELKTLGQNYILTVALASWFAAQLIKVILNCITQKEVVWERLVGAGGMPSSHSALVCSMTVGMARKTGLGSPEFALAFLIAAVVMYDAMGVRRAAGEHAKVLNQIVSFFNKDSQVIQSGKPSKREKDAEDPASSDKQLKEFLGHTPLEVLAGALLGILIAMTVPIF
jgi:acid phosphatase family membrane protein YuiD